MTREIELPMYIVCNLCKNTGKRVVTRSYGYAEIICDNCYGKKEPLMELELETRSVEDDRRES